jgi:DNA helicase-2/ATP-dependent DNA helicase PcrA
MQLTEEQSKIVSLNQGQHLVLAPPGTGKTELLVQRLSNAVKNGTQQNKMICLTFTNRAAKNMLDRVEKEIGEHKIFIGNIHSYCNTFLRKNKIIPQSTSLLDEEDVELLFNELKQDLHSFVYDKYKKGDDNTREIKTDELLKLNTFIKQKNLNFPESILQNPQIKFCNYKDDNQNQKNAIKMCAEYEQIKKESNFIDFDDLLTLSYAYLSESQENKPIFEWLQIDEVQDLNPLQWAIINKISNKEISHRVFFGDYEQAIFSFMGAKLEILDKVGKESTIHELQNNFRSPQYLLELYNIYAKFWLKPKWKYEPKSLNKLVKTQNSLAYKEIRIPHEVEQRNKWGDVFGYNIEYYSTEDDEIDWIIKNKLPKEPQENTAILVRANSSADKFAQKLNDYGVNYFKISGFDLFRRKVVKDLMAFLNIIVDDNDRNSWIRNFHLYGKIKTLKESRLFVNNMFINGIKPLDVIKQPKIEKTFLDSFLDNFQNKRVVIFDTETTGLDTKNDDIIQIAAIEITNGKLGNIFEVYINTDKDLTESEKIHHISKEYLNKYAIDKKEALQKFIDFIGNDTLIAHNLNFDLNILGSNLNACGFSGLSDKINLYDSIEITKRIYPNLPSYKLEYLLNKLKIEGTNSHNALDDVKATANLILTFESLIKKNQSERINFINNNKIVLNNFKNRFSPLYKALDSKFSDQLPIEEIVGMIISYMNDHLNYKIKNDIYDEIDKLTKHMEFNCKIDEVLVSLNKYIPEYIKYKESDLVLGNEKIVIATVHKAKGLEFENVIIPGCTDDNYPSYFSKQDGDKSIIEDARLLYVAMTRTKKRLLLTSHTLKIIPTKRGLRKLEQKPSRFLKPIVGILNDNGKI